jgi:hypothetical protein
MRFLVNLRKGVGGPHLKARTDNRTAVLQETLVEMTIFRVSKQRLPGTYWVLNDRSILIFGVAHEHV